MSKPGLDWFMLVPSKAMFITSPTIPRQITDTKMIHWARNQVPNLEYEPLTSNRFGNDVLAFDLTFIDRRGQEGNQLLINQFEILRRQSTELRDLSLMRSAPHNPNPPVWYYWGTNKPPLPYNVMAVNFTHRADQTTSAGFSAHTGVQFILELEQNSKAYTLFKLELEVSIRLAPAQRIATGRPY
jgi:hypothetical protein